MFEQPGFSQAQSSYTPPGVVPVSAPISARVMVATISSHDGEPATVRASLSETDTGACAVLQYDYADLDPVGCSFTADGIPEYTVTERDGRTLTLKAV